MFIPKDIILRDYDLKKPFQTNSSPVLIKCNNSVSLDKVLSLLHFIFIILYKLKSNGLGEEWD